MRLHTSWKQSVDRLKHIYRKWKLKSHKVNIEVTAHATYRYKERFCSKSMFHSLNNKQVNKIVIDFLMDSYKNDRILFVSDQKEKHVSRYQIDDTTWILHIHEHKKKYVKIKVITCWKNDDQYYD